MNEVGQNTADNLENDGAIMGPLTAYLQWKSSCHCSKDMSMISKSLRLENGIVVLTFLIQYSSDFCFTMRLGQGKVSSLSGTQEKNLQVEEIKYTGE